MRVLNERACYPLAAGALSHAGWDHGRMWEYRAALLRVIDGDTLALLIDQGFGGRQEEHIRLAGVSAPELSQPGGVESARWVADWLALAAGPRWPLLLRTQPNTNVEPTERRTLTRYLGTVTAGPRYLNGDLAAYLAIHPEWGSGS